jgi:DNA-binding NtrC family response regulator
MSQESGRILIVDDEPSLLKMMGAYLGRLGYEITVANSTQEAWDLIARRPDAFDMAVLDASMAGICMADLALYILTANASVRVLASSGYPVDTTALELAAPGRVDFLQKPYTPRALADTVRRMLGPQEEGI